MKAFVTGGSGFVGQNLIPILIAQGYSVNALARSLKAAEAVKRAGATAIEGDLDLPIALRRGMTGCDAVFHLAASVDFYATEKELHGVHVTGTINLLNEARNARVKNFIYLSAASVIMNGKPISDADETFVSDNVIDGYSQTKLAAEKIVLEANAPGFKTIAIRAPLIWGKGDQHVLPSIIKAIEKGRMQFIGGGGHKIVTCHVRNVCEALILAEEAEHGGSAYFISDEAPVVFKDFVTRYVATQGVAVPDKPVSLGAAKFIAAVMEFAWKTFSLKGTPPLHRAMVNTLGLNFTVNDAKARKELGYTGKVTMEQGLKEMQ